MGRRLGGPCRRRNCLFDWSEAELLLVVVHHFVICVVEVLLLVVSTSCTSCAGSGAGCLIDTGGDGLEHVTQLSAGGLDGLGIGALQGLFQLLLAGVDLGLFVGGDLIAQICLLYTSPSPRD